MKALLSFLISCTIFFSNSSYSFNGVWGIDEPAQEKNATVCTYVLPDKTEIETTNIVALRIYNNALFIWTRDNDLYILSFKTQHLAVVYTQGLLNGQYCKKPSQTASLTSDSKTNQ